MNHTGEHSVGRTPRPAGPAHSDLPLAANGNSGALERPARSFSADVVAAKAGDQDAAVLSVLGDIDLESSPLLRELMLPVFERGTCPVVVDLSGATFMDASAVHFLVDTLRRLQDQSRRFAIVCRGRGHVHRLLALVGIVDARIVHRSRESALADGDELMRSEPYADIAPSDGRAL